MILEGKTVNVGKSSEEVFAFLSDFKNFEKLMPQEVSKFEADDNSFIFGIKGMPEIRLIKKSQTEFSQIVLEAASSKLPIELAADIVADGNNCNVKLTFNGDFNPMIKMMVQKPLTSFIESLSNNIASL